MELSGTNIPCNIAKPHALCAPHIPWLYSDSNLSRIYSWAIIGRKWNRFFLVNCLTRHLAVLLSSILCAESQTEHRLLEIQARQLYHSPIHGTYPLNHSAQTVELWVQPIIKQLVHSGVIYPSLVFCKCLTLCYSWNIAKEMANFYILLSTDFVWGHHEDIMQIEYEMENLPVIQEWMLWKSTHPRDLSTQCLSLSPVNLLLPCHGMCFRSYLGQRIARQIFFTKSLWHYIK